MKHSIVYLAALMSMSNAVPVAQFGGFSIPSFPGFSMPSLPGRPTATNTAGAGGSISALPTSVKATATGISQPTQTGSTGGGIVGGNCTPPGSGGGSTEDGVKDKNENNYCCTDVTVIFARGTGETGNMGTVTGPPMVKSLRTKLGAGRVTVQGVDYSASTSGNGNLGADGGPKMASYVAKALAQCPSSKIVVSGYSQGAMVVHNAFSAHGLKPSQVSAVVLFGDPLIRTSIKDLPANKLKEFCGSSDTVCGQPTGGVQGGHLSYGSVADNAASFIISAAGLA